MIDRGWMKVALLDDRVQAFIARDGAEITALYVSGSAHRKGLGKALLEDAMTEADALWLDVRADNKSAARFYRRSGFQEIETGGGAADVIRMEWRREVEI